MATINQFEDLTIWQEAKKLNVIIFKLTNSGNFKNHDHLRIQMERSAGSVMDNIAEGFERGGNKELIQFLYFSKGSCGELRSQLYRSYDYSLISDEELKTCIEICRHVSVKIFAFINYLKKSVYKGDKYNISEPEGIYNNNNANL